MAVIRKSFGLSNREAGFWDGSGFLAMPEPTARERILLDALSKVRSGMNAETTGYLLRVDSRNVELPRTRPSEAPSYKLVREVVLLPDYFAKDSYASAYAAVAKKGTHDPGLDVVRLADDYFAQASKHGVEIVATCKAVAKTARDLFKLPDFDECPNQASGAFANYQSIGVFVAEYHLGIVTGANPNRFKDSNGEDVGCLYVNNLNEKLWQGPAAIVEKAQDVLDDLIGEYKALAAKKRALAQMRERAWQLNDELQLLISRINKTAMQALDEDGDDLKGKTKKPATSALEKSQAGPIGKRKGGMTYNQDFSAATWEGKQVSLTPAQGKVCRALEILLEEEGKPVLSFKLDTLLRKLSEMRLSVSVPRLGGMFHKHPFWKRVIKPLGRTKGTYIYDPAA